MTLDIVSVVKTGYLTLTLKDEEVIEKIAKNTRSQSQIYKGKSGHC